MKANKAIKEWLIRIGHLFSQPRSRGTVKKILLVMFGATFLISTYLLSFPYIGAGYDYKVGDIAREEIRVHQDIRYPDHETTQKFKKEAYERQRYIFDRDYAVFSKSIEKFTEAFNRLKNKTQRAEARKNLPFLRRYSQAEVNQLLADKYKDKLIPWGRRYAAEVFESFGILKHPLPRLEKFYSIKADVRTINSPSTQEMLIFDSDQFIYHKNIFGKPYERLAGLGDESFREELPAAVRKIVIRYLLLQFYKNPYMSYNPAETKRAKERARDQVTMKYQVIPQGTVIVRTDGVIDKDTHKKLKMIEANQEAFSLRYILGMMFIQLMLTLGVGVFLFRYADFKLTDISSHTILHSLLLMVIFYAFVVSRFFRDPGTDYYLGLYVPVGFFSTLMGILFGARVTLAVGSYLSVFLYLISGYEAATLVLSFVSVITGIYASERMQKRTQFLQGAMIISICMVVVLVGFDLVQNLWGEQTLVKTGIAMLNGFLGMIVAVGVLPIYEVIFNLPTKFRLMELADSDNYLLRKVANEAPSTYTHTITVGSLSERAVRAIGGDTLLTRVGCMYHDIGKTINPSFYAENKHLFPTSENFKKLGPLKSAQIILAHVIDGVRMGREHRLPEKVISFIPEHHGTTTMQFFYHQALEESRKKKSSRVLPKELFQYPGPKPQTRETGIVMIADSVEAAARSLKEPGEEQLSELIDRIIQNKIDEDQFDECPLSLGDLKKVKAAFLEVLISSFHLRPSYPSMKKTKDLEKKVSSKKKATARTTGARTTNRSSRKAPATKKAKKKKR